MRNISSIILAIILTYHSKKTTKDQEMIKNLDVNQPEKLKQSLQELTEFYDQ